MNHFEDLSVFAFLVSLVLAFLTRRTLVDRIKYTLLAFLAFLLVAIGIGWLMYPLSR